MSLSTDWDALWREDPSAFHQWPENELVRWASTLERGSRVLEVGCGNGANLRALKSFDLDVVGIDIAREALLASPWLWKGCEVKVGSAVELEFDGESFDAVADVQCLQHLASEDLLIAYAEASRVLNHNGRFFSMHIIEGQRRYPHLTFCEFSLPALLAVGFKGISKGYLTRNWNGDKLTYALVDAVKPYPGGRIVP